MTTGTFRGTSGRRAWAATALAGSLAAVWAFMAAVPAAADGGAGEVERALALLDTLDAVTVTVDYDDEPLGEVIRHLAGLLPVSFAADWPALRMLSVRPRDRVTLRATSVSAAFALASLSFELSDGLDRPRVEAYAGQIVLTTPEATAAMQVTDVYDLRDLLADETTLRTVREDVPPIPVVDPDPEPGPETDPEPDDAPGIALSPIENLSDRPEPPPLTPGVELMNLLVDHVDPEAWHTYGGDRASISEHGGAVVVTAPPSMHRKLRNVLKRLRRLHPQAVTIEATIVDLPRPILDQLTRRFDRASAALGRAVLLAPAAAPLWRAASGVGLDQDLSLRSTNGGIEITVGIHARFDREAGLLGLDVDVTCRDGDDERTVETTVNVLLRGGSVVIELPAATSTDSARLLVLVPG